MLVIHQFYCMRKQLALSNCRGIFGVTEIFSLITDVSDFALDTSRAPLY